MRAPALAAASDPLHVRLWAYQRERFPLLKTALLLAAFTSASVNASAWLGGRPLPGLATYATAFVLALVLMFELRVLDEFKDHETDRAHRPERPVPRGLVTLRLLAGLGAAAACMAVAAALLLDPRLVLILGLVGAFMALMTVHFFVPRLLHASLALTLASHMLVMPLIDFLVTACEWLPRGGGPPDGLWVFLGLSFANGCVLEIGRKTWAPEAERAGVESYSSAWGLSLALLAWTGCLAAALTLLAVLSAILKTVLIVIAALPAVAFGLFAAARLLRQQDRAAQAQLDAAAGFWVLTAYLAAGYAPLAARLLP